jgi:hypothetical protein
MSSAKKKSKAKSAVKFRDLKSGKNLKGGSLVTDSASPNLYSPNLKWLKVD